MATLRFERLSKRLRGVRLVARLKPGRAVLALLLSMTVVTASPARALEFPGPNPGKARAQRKGDLLVLGNRVLSATWSVADGRLGAVRVRSSLAARALALTNEAFEIFLANGAVYPASALTQDGKAVITELAANPRSARSAARSPGREIDLPFRSSDGRLRVVWRAVMRDGANYLRQQIEVTASGADDVVKSIVWLDGVIPGASEAGRVDGSPIVAGSFFFAPENPMAHNAIVRLAPGRRKAAGAAAVDPADPLGQGKAIGRVICRVPCAVALRRGQTFRQSFVVGVAPAGQMRRAFLYYLERERAHPYRPFLHYNSWYDIAWAPFALNQTNCMDAIRTFGERFIKPYNVKVDSMVFDDGWDDPKTLWHFHSGFPSGFTPLAKLCRHYHTHLGVWLSPFGGYGVPKQQRLKYGREQGYEINAAGFSLAGPRYYAAFKHACIGMIRKYGVNYFKFDGIASGTYASGAGAAFLPDTEALCRLMRDLRREEPRLFINFTTGSWPSPFWLRYADSLWRQGQDTGFRGEGPKQQQWLTYRDSEEYRNIVQRAPLYPLNSLMTGGITYSRHGNPGNPSYNSAGLKDDIRTYFGSGTGLQELYIEPARLKPEDWKVLAATAKWSRANADVLVDTHWIGGDPARGGIYGWAAWTPRKGIITLRNPSARAETYKLDVARAFQLPAGAPKRFVLMSPWTEGKQKQDLDAEPGKPLRLHLSPFQVVVLDARPIR